MNHSHPSKWLFAGVLVRIDWIAAARDLPCRDGCIRRVRTGDTVVALATGNSDHDRRPQPRNAHRGAVGGAGATTKARPTMGATQATDVPYGPLQRFDDVMPVRLQPVDIEPRIGVA